MYQEQQYIEEIDLDRYPGRRKFSEMLKVCDCGRTTLLDEPCRNCGKTPQKRLFEQQTGANMKYLFRLYGITAGCFIAAAILAKLFLHIAVFIVLLVGMVAVLAAEAVMMRRFQKKDMDMYFMLHHGQSKNSEQNTAVGSAALEEIMDAYYLDMNRIEETSRQAEAQADRAAARELWLQVLRDCETLSYVYSNPRLSRAELHALLRLERSDVNGVDLNQVCSHLKGSDIENDMVWKAWHLLGDCLLGEYVLDNDQIKRLFFELIERSADIRAKQFMEEPVRPGEEYSRLLRCVGEGAFASAWKELEYDDRGNLIPPNDKDQMRALSKRVVEQERVNHEDYVSSGLWVELLRCVEACDDEQMQKAADVLRRRYCYSEQNEIYSQVYQNLITGKNMDVDEALLPEEIYFITNVVNQCIYNENGDLYDTKESGWVYRVVKRSRSELIVKLQNCWRTAQEHNSMENSRPVLSRTNAYEPAAAEQ